MTEATALSGLEQELQSGGNFITSLILSVAIISLFPNPLSKFGSSLVIVSGIESIFYTFKIRNIFFIKQVLIIVLSIAYSFY